MLGNRHYMGIKLNIGNKLVIIYGHYCLGFLSATAQVSPLRFAYGSSRSPSGSGWPRCSSSGI